MEIYHGSNEKVQFPQIRISKYTKDFSWRFYCTNNKRQAIKWAMRNDDTPTINIYTYTEKDNLKIIKFEKITDEWLDLDILPIKLVFIL
jgi:hypothetical protein